MIDNIDKCLSFIEPETEDDFWYLQILQRKKENSQLGSNSRVIKNYYISNPEYLVNKYSEIKKLCDIFNARAMLRLNKRSYEKVAFKSIQNIANSMSNKEYPFIKKSYDRACGLGHNDSNKKWILDIDGELPFCTLMEMEDVINKSKPDGKNTIIYIPSKNGLHLITKSFDAREFQKKFPDVSVHKDNPTNLYIP